MLSCTGCRLIGRTLDFTFRTILNLLPFFLLVSVDDDGDGTPDREGTYVVWLDEEQGLVEVRGEGSATEMLDVVRAELTDRGALLEVRAGRNRDTHAATVRQLLVPRGESASADLGEGVHVCARQADQWERGSVSHPELTKHFRVWTDILATSSLVILSKLVVRFSGSVMTGRFDWSSNSAI